MAAPQKLTNRALDEFTAVAIKGVTPAELAEKFNISKSSVHAYKADLRAKGVAIPNIQGRRPKQTYPTPENITPSDTEQPGVMLSRFHSPGRPDGLAALPTGGSAQAHQPAHVTFLVNNMKVIIDSRADVIIEDGIIMVNFPENS